MELTVLGRKRKGKKYFALFSSNEFGYNVELVYNKHTLTHYNVKTIEWLHSGEEVYLCRFEQQVINRDGSFNLTVCKSVKITNAKVKGLDLSKNN